MKLESQEGYFPTNPESPLTIIGNEAAQALPSHLILIDPENLGCIGRRLKLARQHSQLELSDITCKTRVPIRYLQAFENADTDQYPDAAYVKGHLRAHARAVGLDADILVRAHEAMRERGPEIESSDTSTTDNCLRRAFIRVASVLGVFLVSSGIVWLGWRLETRSEDPIRMTPFAEYAIPVAGVSDSTRMVQVEMPDLNLVSLRDTDIRIQGHDGTVFVSRVMRAGETYMPPLGHGWTVTTKDGGAFAWQLEGRIYGALAGAGTPVLALEVDEVLQEIMAREVTG